ncbi:CLUMA_CG021596, isoform A [Clunio marinus]|uniref:CLUMA_CG021596, isoform A n=1 Tax=Clunio marinus TaxID=568069 RepID=A0A1J1J8Y2_9DIPT|nr:CLUMA_CG021596, isoform A [Clunio marinus]
MFFDICGIFLQQRRNEKENFINFSTIVTLSPSLFVSISTTQQRSLRQIPPEKCNQLSGKCFLEDYTTLRRCFIDFPPPSTLPPLSKSLFVTNLRILSSTSKH